MNNLSKDNIIEIKGIIGDDLLKNNKNNEEDYIL